jgi:hypothetical protein
MQNVYKNSTLIIAAMMIANANVGNTRSLYAPKGYIVSHYIVTVLRPKCVELYISDDQMFDQGGLEDYLAGH